MNPERSEWVAAEKGRWSFYQRGNTICKKNPRLAAAATLGHELGLEVHAGHGIQIANLAELNAVPYLTELNIGHTIIARAIFTGLTAAVREMKDAIDTYTW